MGLTISYELTHLAIDAAEAERLVRALHAHAQTLGFERVTPVFHETEDDEHDDTFGAVYPGRRFIETGREREPVEDEPPPPPRKPMTDEEVEAEVEAIMEMLDENQRRHEMGLPEEEGPSFGAELIDATGGRVLDVHPLESWFFWASHPGSEPMLVGLARYPAVIEHEVEGVPDTFETGLGVGWHWEGFCKTQYAGLPDAGGEANFLRCHGAVVGVLDHAVSLGLTAEVHDDSGYWDHRDDARLLADLHQWNAMTASIAGRLKDTGRPIDAPILGHPNFEHLEAEGERAFGRRREQLRGASEAPDADDPAEGLPPKG